MELNGANDLKEPWLAVCLSYVYPGLGQIYSGQKLKGYLFAALNLFMSIAFISLVVISIYRESLQSLIIKIIAGVTLGLFYMIYNLVDAYKNTKRQNIEATPTKKQPFLAVFLSAIIPGLGQIYNSQWLKGIGLMIFVFLTSSLLEAIGPVGRLLSLLFEGGASLFILNDAYATARKINDQEGNLFSRFGKKVYGIFALWFILYFILAAGFTVIIRTNFIQAFRIPSEAMQPTLLKGDKLFVDKFIYKQSMPKRGDVIVFKYPKDPKKDFIKRVVAFEGETVEIKDGKIFINDKPLTDEPFNKIYYYNHEPYGTTNEKVTVPANSFYVLGDNSANSTDSRFWGFVPKENLIGKAFKIWWPLNRQGFIT